VKLCLAAGKIRGNETWLRAHFEEPGWILFGPEIIREELRTLRDARYENSVAAVVTKLLLRDGRSGKPHKPRVDAAV
jgi:hypothetical protein